MNLYMSISMQMKTCSILYLKISQCQINFNIMIDNHDASFPNDICDKNKRRQRVGSSKVNTMDEKENDIIAESKFLLNRKLTDI